MNKKLVIGSRGSKLSLAYAEKVKGLILKFNPKIEYKIIIKTIKTTGDIFLNKSISDIGGKHLFCKEIEDTLINKKIDIAVHSLKDMDSDETKGLSVQAYIKRNDPRETFVSKKYTKLSELSNAKIGSSSRRRELQIKLINKNIKVKNIRGNIDTRIKKVETGEYDGAILAYAGLQTLKLEKYSREKLEIKDFIPAAGQGIIAVQCRDEDSKIIDILKKINHTDTKICALAERSFLKVLGGDCQTAVGCFATLKNKNINLRAQLFSDDGKKFFNVIKSGEIDNPEAIGKLAGEEILKKSGDSFKKRK